MTFCACFTCKLKTGRLKSTRSVAHKSEVVEQIVGVVCVSVSRKWV